LFRVVLSLLFLSLTLFSSDLTTKEENLLDVTHKYVSEKFDDIS